MSTWIISFHGGSTKDPAVNTLATIQLGGAAPPMRELRGFTVGPDGNLYVVNAYKSNSLIFQFGPAASSPAVYLSTFVSTNLDHPFDLAFGPDGNLYVSNQDNNSVAVFQGPSGSTPGAFVKNFISSGVNTLRGIACDGTNWYVADEKGGKGKNGAVLVYDSSGNQKYSVDIADPVHLVYDGQRYLYVGSGSANDVQVFDTTNTKSPSASSIFGKGGANPPIDATSGLALPGDGFIYVASRKGQQVLKYPLTTPASAGQGSVFLDQLPDQPEFIGVIGSGTFG
jgi:hypothetical protein